MVTECEWLEVKDSSYSRAMDLEPVAVRPVIDHSRCEAKRACVRVCPVNVFEVRRIEPAHYGQLSAFGRLRSVAHRRMTAYADRAEQCTGCGLCVTACPEQAITLVPRATA
jgi:4Fe-4S ferredoxin